MCTSLCTHSPIFSPQAACALGRIASDIKYRDVVLDKGALLPLLDLLKGNSKASMLVRAARAAANTERPALAQPPSISRAAA